MCFGDINMKKFYPLRYLGYAIGKWVMVSYRHDIFF